MSNRDKAIEALKVLYETPEGEPAGRTFAMTAAVVRAVLHLADVIEGAPAGPRVASTPLDTGFYANDKLPPPLLEAKAKREAAQRPEGPVPPKEVVEAFDLDLGVEDDADDDNPFAEKKVCGSCGGDVWDNTGENAERRAKGQKERPDYTCKNKDGCGWIQWPQKQKAGAR